MKWRYFAILGLIGALAGCDDAKISGTERRSFLKAADLAALPDVGGMLVEIHGAPWAGAMPDKIAGTLRMPDGVAKAARFRAIAPGEWVIGESERLVLHFNPIGAPDHVADCRITEEFETKPPAKRGFSVSATYCKGPDWLIHTHLRAGAVAENNWVGYVVAMQKLLGVLFPED